MTPKISYSQPTEHPVSKSTAMRQLCILLWSLPLIWVIGGERLLLPAIIVVALAPHLNRLTTIPRRTFPLVIFLFGYLASAVMISDKSRYITFTWDLIIYLSYTITILAIAKTVTSLEDLKRLLSTLYLSSIIIHLIGVSYFLIGPLNFPTPLGFVLPSGIKNTQTGRTISIHSTGRELFFMGINTRLSSIFVSSMQYAAAALITLPLYVYYIYNNKGASKLLAIMALPLALSGLFFAQGRTALVLGACVLLFYPLYFSFTKIKGLNLAGLFSSILIAISASIIALLLSLPYITSTFNELFIEQRASSAKERFEVYEQSSQAILDSPLLGHGTQETVEDLAVPLGSHNWYLAVLFKHGLIGFIPLIIFLASVLSTSIKNTFSTKTPALRSLSVMLFFSTSAHLLLCLTAEPVIDAVHVFFLAIIHGSVFSMAAIIRQDRSAPPSAPLTRPDRI